jgi:hypothetical protein
MISPLKISILALLILVCVTAAAFAAEPEGEVSVCAGLVVSTEGDVTVVRNGAALPATEGFVLAGDDVVVVRGEGTCAGFTVAGGTFELKGPAELRLSGFAERGVLGRTADWISAQSAKLMRGGSRKLLITRAIPEDREVLASAPGPLLPAPDGQVRPSEPEFYWTTVPEIETYLVTFLSAAGEETTELVEGHHVRFDAAVPGGAYAWRIEPSVTGALWQSEWRSFRVMTEEDEQKLDLALSELDDLECGVLLMAVGLHAEAVDRFDTVITSGRRSHSAHVWRAKALAELGLYRNAYEDLLEAGTRG